MARPEGLDAKGNAVTTAKAGFAGDESGRFEDIATPSPCLLQNVLTKMTEVPRATFLQQ
jgi:hypothetical protein